MIVVGDDEFKGACDGLDLPALFHDPRFPTLSERFARYEELFSLIRDELRRSGFEEAIAAGVVLTGGSSKMEGAVELAEEIFHVPVRLGVPTGVTALGEVVRNPIHATGVGLLLYGRANTGHVPHKPIGEGVKSVFERMKSWFQGYF